MDDADLLNNEDIELIPPEVDFTITKGKGKSVEIPAEGYILDLVVIYDNTMPSHFGSISAAETR